MPNAEDGEALYIDEDEYERIRCEPGRYRVEVYRLIGADEEPSAKRLPDYVVRLLPFVQGEQAPRLTTLPDLSALDSNADAEHS